MALSKVDLANQVENQLPQSLVADNVNFRNIVINGDMSIAQRATSTSSITGTGIHTVDRFKIVASSAGTWTQSQSTDVPTGQGFATSLKMDCTTANASLSAGSTLQFTQRFEGQMLQYLKKGTSSAESLTLSFWVKSNKTGTYIARLFDNDNTRSISKSYTISSADTWEKKTITFAGDTTGALDNDNNQSLYLILYLLSGTDGTSGTLNTSWNTNVAANNAVGQVNLADDTANEWYVTGVQLEAGTAASDFEFLPVDVNRYRCFRYCYRINGNASDQQQCGAIGFANGGSTLNAMMRFSPHMRTAPTVTEDNMSQTTTGSAISLTGTFDNTDTSDCNAAGLSFSADSGSPFTTGNVMFPRVNSSTSAFIQFDAEL